MTQQDKAAGAVSIDIAAMLDVFGARPDDLNKAALMAHIVAQLAQRSEAGFAEGHTAAMEEVGSDDELRDRARIAEASLARLVEALQFYADGCHFHMHDASAWDTVSGEPPNFYEDESNTATVEDGSVAKQALALLPAKAEAQDSPAAEHIAHAHQQATSNANENNGLALKSGAEQAATRPAHETIIAEADRLVCTACGTTSPAGSVRSTPAPAMGEELPPGEHREACPFCGSANISDGEEMTMDQAGECVTQSMCEDCGAMGPGAALGPDEVDYGDVKARAAWNRRACMALRQPGAYEFPTFSDWLASPINGHGNVYQYANLAFDAARRTTSAAPVSQPAAQDDADKLRAEGRAEALAILMGLDPETGIEEYTGWSNPVGPEDEGSAYWEEAKLRELFCVDGKLASMRDEAEAAYWQYIGHEDEADRAKAFAANMHNSGAVRAALEKHKEYDLIAVLCTAPAPLSTPAVSQPAAVPDQTGDIFDLIREWEHLPEGQRGDVARNIIGQLNKSYAAGVKDTRELIAASSPQPVQSATQESVGEPAKLDTDQSREYLVRFMEQHFTDKTYHRYIRGQRGTVNLAGDFAWQMARAIRMLAAPQRKYGPLPAAPADAPGTRSFCGGHALAAYDPGPPLDWADQAGACSICDGTRVTFGKHCVCVVASAGGAL